MSNETIELDEGRAGDDFREKKNSIVSELVYGDECDVSTQKEESTQLTPEECGGDASSRFCTKLTESVEKGKKDGGKIGS